MQSIKSISAFFLLMMLVLGLRAQNGTAVVSEAKATDLGNGMAKLEVRISGNQAGFIESGSFSAQPSNGNGIAFLGNLVSVNEGPILGGPRDIILFGNFPYTPSGGNGPDLYDVEISILGRPRGRADKIMIIAVTHSMF
jgi:hypothetical protein